MVKAKVIARFVEKGIVVDIGKTIELDEKRAESLAKHGFVEYDKPTPKPRKKAVDKDDESN